MDDQKVAESDEEVQHQEGHLSQQSVMTGWILLSSFVVAGN
jgi:hypothetical protein